MVMERVGVQNSTFVLYCNVLLLNRRMNSSIFYVIIIINFGRFSYVYKIMRIYAFLRELHGATNS